MQTTTNANDLLYSTRSLAQAWRNALVPETYSRTRGLSRWPDRFADGRKPVVERDGVGTVMARSIAAKCGQENYALRTELGQRAYDCLYGLKAKRLSPPVLASSKRAKA